jgi:hypothetical protein
VSELADLLNRLNLTVEDIRQVVVQSSRGTGGGGGAGGGGSGGATGGGGGGPSKAALNAAAQASEDFAAGISGKLGSQIGSALSGGVSGIASFGKSAISNGLGGGLAGSVGGAAFQLGIQAFSDVNQGANAAISATPLFSSSNFNDQAARFGAQRGFNNFFGQTLGLNNFTSFFTEDNKRIDEAQEHEQSPVLKAASSLADFAAQIAEQGGDVDVDAFRELGAAEIEKNQRGQDARETVFRAITDLGATNPSAGLWAGRR